MQPDSPMPAIPDQAAAKNASLIKLAQYVVAVDGTKVVPGDAKKAFAVAQEIAALVLIEALGEFSFKEPAAKPRAGEPHRQLRRVARPSAGAAAPPSRDDRRSAARGASRGTDALSCTASE